METPFKYEQVYDASIAEVWQALTETNELRDWYFPQLIEFKPVVNFEFIFKNDGSPYQKEWRVTQVVEGQRIAHSWSYKEYPGSSEVVFDLFEEAGKTKLGLTHIGLESFPNDLHFARKRFEDGWKQILGSNLKNHLRSS